MLSALKRGLAWSSQAAWGVATHCAEAHVPERFKRFIPISHEATQVLLHRMLCVLESAEAERLPEAFGLA